MSSVEARVHAFSKKPSSVKHKGTVVRTVARKDVVELNKTIEPKIRQNERERSASMHAAARCIVGGNR